MKSYMSKEMRRFNHLIVETNAAYHEIALRFGLSDSAMEILYTICDYGEGDACPLQEVCRQTGISKQTINSAIRKLEAEGMIYMEQSGTRTKRLCLTKEGKLLAQNTVVKLMEAENEILRSWPEEDVEKYLALTERFLASIREKTGDMTAEMRSRDNHNGGIKK